MRLESSVFDLNWPHVESRIERFIADYIESSGRKGVTLGLSGGIDSSTTAALCSSAVGGSNTLGLFLPEQETYSTCDLDHIKAVENQFGFKTEIVDISETLESFYTSIPIFEPANNICRGNIKARARMIYIYYYANMFDLLVCGSSDKSETMVGYFTKWGDIAADISPIMDLYKTQVRKLAEHMELPQEVVTKPPSPTLWPGQLAIEELGIEYETLDLILYGLEHFMKSEEISRELGIGKILVEKIKGRWLLMEHKRRMPLTAKIGYRTVGNDFRLPRGFG